MLAGHGGARAWRGRACRTGTARRRRRPAEGGERRACPEQRRRDRTEQPGRVSAVVAGAGRPVGVRRPVRMRVRGLGPARCGAARRVAGAVHWFAGGSRLGVGHVVGIGADSGSRQGGSGRIRLVRHRREAGVVAGRQCRAGQRQHVVTQLGHEPRELGADPAGAVLRVGAQRPGDHAQQQVDYLDRIGGTGRHRIGVAQRGELDGRRGGDLRAAIALTRPLTVGCGPASGFLSGCLLGDLRGLGLAATDHVAGRACRTAAVLHHVGDLVREQPPPGRARGVVPAAREEDVRSQHEGRGADRFGEGGRLGVVVDPHVGEALSQQALEVGLHRTGQRLAGRHQLVRRPRVAARAWPGRTPGQAVPSDGRALEAIEGAGRAHAGPRFARDGHAETRCPCAARRDSLMPVPAPRGRVAARLRAALPRVPAPRQAAARPRERWAAVSGRLSRTRSACRRTAGSAA